MPLWSNNKYDVTWQVPIEIKKKACSSWLSQTVRDKERLCIRTARGLNKVDICPFPHSNYCPPVPWPFPPVPPQLQILSAAHAFMVMMVMSLSCKSTDGRGTPDRTGGTGVILASLQLPRRRIWARSWRRWCRSRRDVTREGRPARPAWSSPLILVFDLWSWPLIYDLWWHVEPEVDQTAIWRRRVISVSELCFRPRWG